MQNDHNTRTGAGQFHPAQASVWEHIGGISGERESSRPW